jgi:anaerobic selenocysteine-containing dehydrogenase
VVNDHGLLPPGQAGKALGLAQRPLGPPARGWIAAEDFRTAILIGEPYRLRGLMSFGANLVVSQADPEGSEAALRALDFYVHCDLFENPTARFADILLPVNSPWEREGLRIGFEIDAAAEKLIQLRPRMVEPFGDSRSDLEIVFDLATRLGLGEAFFGGSIEAGWNHILAPTGITVADLRASPAGIRRLLEQMERRYAERLAQGQPAFATPSGRAGGWSCIPNAYYAMGNRPCRASCRRVIRAPLSPSPSLRRRAAVTATASIVASPRSAAARPRRRRRSIPNWPVHAA